MSKVTDFIIDWETMGNAPDGAVVDLAVLVFEHDPYKLPTFEDLCKRGRRFKFNLQEQKGMRFFDQGTIDWWKKTGCRSSKAS
ncbi:exonuclease A [Aeromonas phage AS-gz]|uniref:Exonuclease A n=1 Tax=Aeromonas phage AS-gz TaxID=2026082 RepID=A0A223LF44_9CAUD|nr:exonuclease A [Aeromonas phage AS-gz]ASU00658.1 exonuclease A [Aeromonas phage AS-gz]